MCFEHLGRFVHVTGGDERLGQGYQIRRLSRVERHRLAVVCDRLVRLTPALGDDALKMGRLR